jgi:hypothetical protein
MTLRDLIQEIRTGWPAYRALSQTSSAEQIFQLVETALPDELRTALQKGAAYKVEGSTGSGNITAAPWIGARDPQVSKSFTEGFYLVYLFSIDLRRLYLSLAFGTTQFRNYFKTASVTHEKLASAARHLRKLVDPNRPLLTQKLDLSATSKNRLHYDYEYSNIFAIAYDLETIPGNSVLMADYQFMLDLYAKLVSNPLLPTMNQLLESEVPLPPQTLPPIIVEFQPRPPKVGGNNSKTGTISRISVQSKKVGDRGEQIVSDYETARVGASGGDVSKIRWHSREGETPGWDISSVESSGETLRIEVKASIGSTVSSLIISANEWEAARVHGSAYAIYLVTNAFKTQPRIEVIRDPFRLVQERTLRLEVASFLVGLSAESEEQLEPSIDSTSGVE